MSTTIAYDAISANVNTLPGGQHCGYVTGTSDIQWSSAQFTADPSAVRIDQSPVNTVIDDTADVLDFENGAATLADIVPWVTQARVNFSSAARPGQREPMIYCNQSSLTEVCNTLAAAGLSVPIWLAVPGLPLSSAESDVSTANGPYPTYAIQYAWNSAYDADVFSSSWLTAVSGKSGDTIMAGDYGPAVQACQERINVWASAAKLATLTVDGCFGPVTLVAVQGFQEYKKLAVDGIAGPLTWAALDASPVDPPPAPVEFAAPSGFRYGDVTLALSWDAVPPVNGKKPVSYTVQVFLADGQDMGTKIAGGTSTSVVLSVGKSYVINVWANGGSVAPPHATLNVTV